MTNYRVAYQCAGKACHNGPDFCGPCKLTFKPEHAKNPEIVKAFEIVAKNFELDLRVTTLSSGDKIGYEFIFTERKNPDAMEPK